MNPQVQPAKPAWPKRRWALLLSLLAPPLALQYLGRFRAGCGLWLVVMGVAAIHFAIGEQWGQASSGLLVLGVAIHSWRAVARARVPNGGEARARPNSSRWKALLLTWIAVLLLVTVQRLFLFEPMRMPSSSMQPGLAMGDVIWTCKWGGGTKHAWGLVLHRGVTTMHVQRGDLIVFEAPGLPGKLFVQRVVALPGDEVEVRAHGLWVNGRAARTETPLKPFFDADRNLMLDVREEQLDGRRYRVSMQPDSQGDLHANMPARQVPAQQLFVLGDTRDNASDGRIWGWLPIDRVVGHVSARAVTER